MHSSELIVTADARYAGGGLLVQSAHFSTVFPTDVDRCAQRNWVTRTCAEVGTQDVSSGCKNNVLTESKYGLSDMDFLRKWTLVISYVLTMSNPQRIQRW